MRSRKAGLPFATRARKRELSIREVRIENESDRKFSKSKLFRSFSENHFSPRFMLPCSLLAENIFLVFQRLVKKVLIFRDSSWNVTKNMHFKILKIHFINEISGKNPAKFLKPELEPDIEAGYPAGSGFSRISGRFLLWMNPYHQLINKIHWKYIQYYSITIKSGKLSLPI